MSLRQLSENKFHEACLLAMEHSLARITLATALWKPEFKQCLAEKDVHFLMTTSQGGPSAWYTIANGRMSVRTRSRRPPDFTLEWSSPRAGWHAMAAMATGDPKAVTRAVMAGDLKLAGEGALVGWYLGILAKMAKVYKTKQWKNRALEFVDNIPLAGRLARITLRRQNPRTGGKKEI
ncbi:MAG: hypothetical protein ABIM40_05805 [Pseudomonadota bacterium]